MIDIGQEGRLKDEFQVSGLGNNNQHIVSNTYTVLSALIILSHLNLTSFLSSMNVILILAMGKQSQRD